jgi:hypothetical protein
MKTCTKCKLEKEKTEYYKHKNGKDGLNPVCKVCWKQENKIFEENNPRTQYRKKRYTDNREKINKKQTTYNLKRHHQNPEIKLLNNTRTRIKNFLKGKTKSQSTQAILGIDAIGYKKYIENLFQEGMSWENFGEWEIDHILPVSKGGSFHYTNTQPLWKEENRKKGNKII